jgi:hypothetical protein
MNEMNDEKIPVFKKWCHWYWLVIGFQLLLTVLFYLFTKILA